MSFKDILGQGKPINILQNALASNRLSHAYLFEGPPGIGKVFTAINFAKAINCLQRADDVFDCCDQCISCKKIDAGNHIDVRQISLLKGKSEILIDQIRQIQQQINLKPYEAKYKVFCISDAELMNEESQNALLKTLEEPPIRSVIILTTSKLRALFATVVSRCQHVKFSAFSIEHAKDVLVKRYNIKADTAYFLAHIAQSDFVDISVLAKDEVLDKKNRIIDEFSDFLGNPTNELSFLKESDEYILWVLSIILWWYRDMLVLKETAMPSIIANKDRVGDLKMQAARYTTLHLCRIINILLNTASMIHQTNVNSKLALTAMSMDILENANARE